MLSAFILSVRGKIKRMITKYNSYFKFNEIIGKSRRLLNKKKAILHSFAGDGTGAFPPAIIKLYINNICNASCIICDIGTRNKGSVFSKQVLGTERSQLMPDDIRNLIKNVKGFKPEIDIHGLEPLLHEKLDDILGIIKKEKLRVHLVTNGILLVEKSGMLIKNRVDKVTVSLDGVTEVHNRIRGEKVFERATEGIRTLKKIRKEDRGRATEIMTHFTINHLNYGNLFEYTDLMIRDLGVDSVRISHPYFVTESASIAHTSKHPGFGESSPVNVHRFRPDLVDTDVLWEQLEKVKKKMNPLSINFNIRFTSKKKMRDYYLHPEKQLFRMMCRFPWATTTIVSNGNVIISNRCFLYRTGNIHDQSFLDIWKGEAYRTFRRELIKQRSFPTCLRCCGSLPRIGKI